MTPEALITKFTRGRPAWQQREALELVARLYAELLALRTAAIEKMAESSPRYLAQEEYERHYLVDDACCAQIGAAIGATRIKNGAVAYDLSWMRHGRRPQRYRYDDEPETSQFYAPSGALFDHCVSFFLDRAPLAILTRPYPSPQAEAEALALAQIPTLEVWRQPTELCAYYPGWALSFLIMRAGLGHHPGHGFERLVAGAVPVAA